ncbi:MAG: hypothetical protein EBU92_01795 [Betaproteobacteria bacterium]|jgi:hypothetical protein|nr:hypothetical protein [Betaproteobacteria bacterium]
MFIHTILHPWTDPHLSLSTYVPNGGIAIAGNRQLFNDNRQTKQPSRLTVNIPPPPLCQTCKFLMPSPSAKTGLRCGFDYFKASEIARKFKLMSHFPEVKLDNACEKWDPK